MAGSGSRGPDAALTAVFLGRGGEVEEEWVQRRGRELQLPEEEVRWRKGT